MAAFTTATTTPAFTGMSASRARPGDNTIVSQLLSHHGRSRESAEHGTEIPFQAA